MKPGLLEFEFIPEIWSEAGAEGLGNIVPLPH